MDSDDDGFYRHIAMSTATRCIGAWKNYTVHPPATGPACVEDNNMVPISMKLASTRIGAKEGIRQTVTVEVVCEKATDNGRADRKMWGSFRRHSTGDSLRSSRMKAEPLGGSSRFCMGGNDRYPWGCGRDIDIHAVLWVNRSLERNNLIPRSSGNTDKIAFWSSHESHHSFMVIA